MEDLVIAFDERLAEIEIYLQFLDELQKQVQQGTPRMGSDAQSFVITVPQQRILYSSVYLQLYNLVESTITRCVNAVVKAIEETGSWLLNQLSEELRREWVRYIARTHTELNFENRLEAALALCENLIQSVPVSAFKIEKGSSGNWDDTAIEGVSRRLGWELRVNPTTHSNIKRSFRNDQGPLVFIRCLRNDLAHGTVSFVECGEGVTVEDLRNLKDLTASYLREVTVFFKTAIDAHAFLLPAHRPV